MNFPHPVLSDEHLPFPLVPLIPSSSGSGSLIAFNGQHPTSPESTSTNLTSRSLKPEAEDFDKMLDMLGIADDTADRKRFTQKKEDVSGSPSKDATAGKVNGNVVKEDNTREGRNSGVSLSLELEDHFSQMCPPAEDSKVQTRFVRHPSASSTSSSQYLTTSSEPVRLTSYNSTYPSYPVSFGSSAGPTSYHRPHSVASDVPSLDENIFSRSYSSPRSITSRRERHQSTSSKLPSYRPPKSSSTQMALVLQPEMRESDEARPSLPTYLQSPMQEVFFKNKVPASGNPSEPIVNSNPLAPPDLPSLEPTLPSTQLSSTSSSSSSSPSLSSYIEPHQPTRSTHFSTFQAHTESSQTTHNSAYSPPTLSSSRHNNPSSNRLFKPRSISSMTLEGDRPSGRHAARSGSTPRSAKEMPQQTYQSSIRGPSPKRRTSVRSLRYEEREDEYEEEDNEDEDEQAESTEEHQEFLNRPLGLLALSHALAAANEEVGTLRSVVRDVNALVTEQAAVLLTSRYLPNHPHLLHSNPVASPSPSSGDAHLVRETGHRLSAGISKVGRRARRDEDWLSLSKEEIDEFSGADARRVLKAITSPQLGLASTIAFLRHIELRLNPLLEGAPSRSDDDVFSNESFQRMNNVLDRLLLGQRQERS
ncbi:hypothetical protein [Phaffia rhodozyma]|uniref:Uncharacterized protein n=1 Tax=Phaffia rhodozyma TaxID=264483 RepID=A0A0F7SSR3_PHARH|nr:hypothetical protein [Phaffia rhodozyma]